MAWAIQLGGIGDDGPSRVVVDNAGNVALIGEINGDALIASLDPSNGAIRWQLPIATSGVDYGWTLRVGVTGDLYAVVDWAAASILVSL